MATETSKDGAKIGRLRIGSFPTNTGPYSAWPSIITKLDVQHLTHPRTLEYSTSAKQVTHVLIF